MNIYNIVRREGVWWAKSAPIPKEISVKSLEAVNKTLFI